MFIYTDFTLNLVETLKTSIYYTKDTHNTKLQFRCFLIVPNSYTAKVRHLNKSGFYDGFNITIVFFLSIATTFTVWGHSLV